MSKLFSKFFFKDIGAPAGLRQSRALFETSAVILGGLGASVPCALSSQIPTRPFQKGSGQRTASPTRRFMWKGS